jgi:hypothetical protein
MHLVLKQSVLETVQYMLDIRCRCDADGMTSQLLPTPIDNLDRKPGATQARLAAG